MSICLIIPYKPLKINTFRKKKSDRKEGGLFGLIFRKRGNFSGDICEPKMDSCLPPTLYVRIFPLSAIYIKRPFTVLSVKRSIICECRVGFCSWSFLLAPHRPKPMRQRMKRGRIWKLEMILFKLLGTFLFPLE